MKDKRLLIIACFVFLFSFVNKIYTCTSFCMNIGNQFVLCKNLDWDFGFGTIEVNKKGLYKRALITGNEVPVEWVSKFGSITFNHIGKEFPLGGMNEAGLVIEEMNYYWTKYPEPDKRPTLNELQWIQYQLDNYSSIKDVIKSDSTVRITGDLFRIHYLISDREGNRATIEFLNGKMIYHTDSSLKVAVLTNHKYDESLEALKNFKGFGGNKDIPQEYESLNNFIRASSMIQNYSSDIPLVDYSFKILSSVSTYDTQWSIVYDITNSRIYFKTKQNQNLKWIDLKKFDFSRSKSSLCLDINVDFVNDVSSKFVPFDLKTNKLLVYRVYNAYSENDFLEEKFDKTYFDKIADYPKNIRPKLKKNVLQ